jgi:hypothetical protein
MAKKPTQLEKAIKALDDEIAALEHAKKKLIEQQQKQTTKRNTASVDEMARALERIHAV